MLVPANPLLYNSIKRMQQAIHHAKPGQTNFAANEGIGEMYMGGYVASKDQVDPKFRDLKQEEKDKEKRKAYELKREKKKKNLL